MGFVGFRNQNVCVCHIERERERERERVFLVCYSTGDNWREGFGSWLLLGGWNVEILGSWLLEFFLWFLEREKCNLSSYKLACSLQPSQKKINIATNF